MGRMGRISLTEGEDPMNVIPSLTLVATRCRHPFPALLGGPSTQPTDFARKIVEQFGWCQHRQPNDQQGGRRAV